MTVDRLLVTAGFLLAVLLAPPGANAQKARPAHLTISTQPGSADYIGMRPAGTRSPLVQVGTTTPLVVTFPVAGLPASISNQYEVVAARREWFFLYQGSKDAMLGDPTTSIVMVPTLRWDVVGAVLALAGIVVTAVLAGAWGLVRGLHKQSRQLEKSLDKVMREKKAMAASKQLSQELPPLLGKALTTQRGESYEVLRLIGNGAMGAVFEACPAHEHDASERWAVKIPFRTTLEDPESRRRFVREAEMCCGVFHPGLVQVLDWGTYVARDRTAASSQDWPFILMELIDGDTLRDVLERKGRQGLPVRQVVEWAEQMVEALRVVHDAGIVHRDLKPENVFITPSGNVKIGDFGVAGRVDRHSMTVAGDALGTPIYMSPEHLEAVSTTSASDIYSLGVMLYELLTGVPPFESDNLFTLMQMILTAEAVPVKVIRADVPTGLADLVTAMMARDPSMRPSDEAVLQRLTRVADLRRTR